MSRFSSFLWFTWEGEIGGEGKGGERGERVGQRHGMRRFTAHQNATLQKRATISGLPSLCSPRG